jgi:hypothetical protein
MDILDTLKSDYSRFPKNQTYSIYAQDVYFKDPMVQFRGRNLYRTMISFMEAWFRDIQFDLHDIQRTDNHIRTDWTLSWTTPLPWKPRIHIPGWSELELNSEGLICAHRDYWRCSKLEVLRQNFRGKSSVS